MWGFPKIVGFPLKSSIFIGFSIIFTIQFWGVSHYFWVSTHFFAFLAFFWGHRFGPETMLCGFPRWYCCCVGRDDADDDECTYLSQCDGWKKGRIFSDFFFSNPWIHVCPETNMTKSFQDFFSPSRGFKKTCCESTKEALLTLD